MCVSANVVGMLLLLFLLPAALCQTHQASCLTGKMTDVQTWVDNYGALTPSVDHSFSIDLSSRPNPTLQLQTRMESLDRTSNQFVKYLSLARCSLQRVPNVFDSLLDSEGRTLSETVEYLTLYGNNFHELSSPGEQYYVALNATGAKEVSFGARLRAEDQTSMTIWFSGFDGVNFEKLKELDLRSCGIETLSSYQFKNMPELEALYLGENIIQHIQSNAFIGLGNLLHLDLSRNRAADQDSGPKTVLFDSKDVFNSLKSLQSLDFSMTQINQRNFAVLRELGKSLERLSLCFAGSLKLSERFFKGTSLKILDLSGNYDVISTYGALGGLESTLQVLYANDVRLNSFDMFVNFRNLEILRLSRNEITSIRKSTLESMKNLKVLDLSRNRLNSWFTRLFSLMPNLQFLDVSNNNINLLSEEMVNDISNISYLGISDNFMLCNCLARDLIELASKNEHRIKTHTIEFEENYQNSRFDYHSSYEDILRYIYLRQNISYVCDNDQCSDDQEIDGDVLLLDYSSVTYSCFEMIEGTTMPQAKVTGCLEERISSDYTVDLANGWNKLLLLIVLPGLLLPAMLLAFMFRRNLRYCYVTMRNSAMLSMVNKNRIIAEDAVFNYDVFVSYCNEDRPWVLDQLLSNLENDGSVSLCLHERDFQVGLSILENIVSCLDRSKFIMLVISQKFLRSQWCQFEMHLAQHRLLETRREDLILILLEDIPRHLRPNTLHYLMLTKTYIVWPKNKTEQHLFWRRLKKTIVTQTQKHENVSLA